MRIEEVLNTVIHGLALETVKELPSESIDSVITSPPYWKLRDYGFPEQWGLEPTFQEFLEHLWQLMDELYRVLKPEGTVWINLGDTYNTVSGNSKCKSPTEQIIGAAHHKSVLSSLSGKEVQTNIPVKSLLMLPHRFAIGCSERNWIVRNDIAWIKPNAMPESITDRFSKKKEYFFVMAKNQKYYFDLDGVREQHKQVSRERYLRGVSEGNKYGNAPGAVGNLSKPRTKIPKENSKMFGSPRARNYDTKHYGRDEKKWRTDGKGMKMDNKYNNPKGKNPGDVNKFWKSHKNLSIDEYLEMCIEYYYSESDIWEISTKPSDKNHFAAYNADLINKPIIAGCKEGGIILDPFAGTGTTLLRAKELNRNVIGIEGNKEYREIAQKTLDDFNSQLTLKFA